MAAKRTRALGDDTADSSYTDQLLSDEGAWWKRIVDIRGIYGWNLRRLNPGFTLDVGCGLGRNLGHLRGNGIGIDHNHISVAVCRSRRHRAFTPGEFAASEFAVEGLFDTLLLSHVVEHMAFDAATNLIQAYEPFLAPKGQVVLIAPQRWGFGSDPTHVEYFDFAKLELLLQSVGRTTIRALSFPLPSPVFGLIFRYNEFVAVG